uniref:Vomeronasal type-1 receptor n=1 Tax=Ditylenchus dipsaci TaxID=166011 RepID=A0A915D1M7_9BILA
MSTVRLIHSYNSSFCLFIGGFLNCFLVYLIKSRTTKEMKVYSRILLQTCVVDLCVLVIGFLSQPIFFAEYGESAKIFNCPFDSSSHMQFLLFCMWIIANFLSSTSMTFQFIYRYLLLCSSYYFACGLSLTFCPLRL